MALVWHYGFLSLALVWHYEKPRKNQCARGSPASRSCPRPAWTRPDPPKPARTRQGRKGKLGQVWARLGPLEPGPPGPATALTGAPQAAVSRRTQKTFKSQILIVEIEKPCRCFPMP